MPFFAKSKDDVGQSAFACVVHNVSSGGALAAHAHVERSVEAEREAAPGGIELHGRDAQIQHNSIDEIVSGLACDAVEIGETILGQCQAAFCLLDQIGAT